MRQYIMGQHIVVYTKTNKESCEVLRMAKEHERKHIHPQNESVDTVVYLS